MSIIDVNKIRSDFPVFEDETLVYLDSAATTQKPRQVIEAISEFYSHSYANVHRGIYNLSTKATEAYHSARVKTQNFINAKDWQSIIFTSGTTESINLVANSWGRKNLNQGDEILITGPTTGVVQTTVQEIRVNLKNTEIAMKKDQCSVPLETLVRRSDKLYKIVDSEKIKQQ